jgi:PIN domain nuclease of toxin-antitoxin system
VNVLLDTYVWLWWLTSDPRLSPRECRALDAVASEGGVHLSVMSLWEALMLHAKGRLTLPLPFGEWLRRAPDARILTLAPLDVSVVLTLDALPPSFHGDPADRVIVATSKTHGWALATHDRAIRRSRVARIWKPGGQ